MMHSVAVFFVQRLLGGAEEGGWYYEAGDLSTEPELVAFGTTFAFGHETRADAVAAEIQAHLDRDWNVGDHARPLDSVLSAGRWEARTFEGWPPTSFPAERPRYG
ncbi:hypothetical protein [Sphingomonas sp. TZW2008]|uniref:hypothetical protein n=1 Tax=Sphingomonas sp. TZW2008 TaxID=1917973 RepID=UPI000A2706D2|nr:hypothetical protein [Sphingomonas sp. TZW2008]